MTAVRSASAFGSRSTRPCPTSRGHGRFFTFLAGRERAQTAASPRAGACRLRRFGGRETGKGEAGFPKRDSQGMDPLGGCGQSPPVSPRDGRGKTRPREKRGDGLCPVHERWKRADAPCPPQKMERRVSPSPARRQSPLMGNALGGTAFFRDIPTSGAPLCSAFAPMGQTASNTHTRSAPCPPRARQRHFPAPPAAVPDLTFRGGVTLKTASGKDAALKRADRVPGGKLCASKNPALCCGHPAVGSVCSGSVQPLYRYAARRSDRRAGDAARRSMGIKGADRERLRAGTACGWAGIRYHPIQRHQQRRET